MPQEFQPRQTAYKVSIADILSSKYIKQEGWDPNYLDIRGKKVSRVNVIATIIDKIESDSLVTITLDDGTSNIVVRAFNEDSKKLSKINIGDLVLIIGRPRVFNNQLFIALEIAKKLDITWSQVRKIELQQLGSITEKVEQPIQQEILNNEQNIGDNPKQYIIKKIRELDKGDGVDIEQIINNSKDKQKIELLIDDLLKQGEVFESRPGKLKLIE